ncbi:phage scaffolding protein [Cytobacillus purgationiresistens]|uniref:Skp family chaperone for outer membrane proteins n=1 Tax=Cytobacillus purgationiresistens TaxID=863449 RepID=A0ABU0AHJ7_9BACI|nr:scaffolding protein [Cytobacillus purgationiresistens]MDQ0270732.1 Skp family chaperone for outer membrane proteins [Cytobacillus purgationiresistens]
MFKRLFLPINLQLFSADLGGEGGDGQSTAAEPEKKTEEQSEKTFTQAELDKILADRVAREKKKQLETADKLKKLEEYEQAEEERKKAAMSEAERLKAEKEEASKKAEEAAEQAKKAQESANQRIVNTEIKSIARSLNANDLNDVLTLLDKSSIEIDDEGNVKGVDEAVNTLKEAKPWMFKQSLGADAVGGSNPAKNPSVNEISAKEKELADAQEKALKDSRFMGTVTRIYNELIALRQRK